MSTSSDIGILMREAYIHICDALDHILKNQKAFEDVLVYKDHNGDIVVSGTSLKLCEALFSTLNDLGRVRVFKSPRSIYHRLSYYHSKDYVEDSYSKGMGWFIEKPILTPRNTKYIIRRKARHNKQ